MFYQLLVDRSRWEEVLADRDLVNAAVEETLRMYGIVHTLVRTTTREVEVAGVTLPKGAAVMLQLDSANHDAARFEDSEKFDLHRPKRTGRPPRLRQRDPLLRGPRLRC